MSKFKGLVAACALVLMVGALLAGVCAGSARAGGAGEIAFVRSGDIWVMSADGSSARRLAELREAVETFIDLYNEQWLPEKNGFMSPSATRAAWYARRGMEVAA